ncbi:hypothetical protein [Deinococcus koreensis]|uniref:Lipocalin-like domain-containing protein n=1 Tax=Deinococcus koreensis TaxID=2054903 RepID=A0A2K3USE7_9DEIO|nr:hypothetical protein [Deinococcus koreensis]PNY79469.1 hypothetical protein CVO96_18720 [Deinococcus koreensis]
MKHPVRTLALLALTSLAPAQAAPASPSLPSGLVGSWLFGSLGTIGYTNTRTGEWQNASSTGELVTIRADGRYERTRMLVMTTYSCTSRLHIYEKGTVSVSGTQLRYQPQEGVNQGYTCSPSNGWRTTTLSPESYTLALGKDSAGRPQLTLHSDKATYQYRPYQP